MHTFPVVEHLNILEHIGFYFLKCNIFLPIDALPFRCGEKTFRTGIIIWASRPAHAPGKPIILQHFLEPLATILNASIAMKQRSLTTSAPCKCVSKRPLYQLRINALADRVTYDFPIILIHHDG